MEVERPPEMISELRIRTKGESHSPPQSTANRALTTDSNVPGIRKSNLIAPKRVLDKQMNPEETLPIDSPSMARASGTDGSTVRLLSRVRGAGGIFEAHMEEANKYYVTVAVDRCIIPGGILVRAASNEAAAQRAEMKVALQMRDAISVTAVNVREV
jgi:hypothetical protein